MRGALGTIATVLLALLPYCHAKEAPLRSPWDGHSVTVSDASYTCPAAPELPRDFATNSYYSDSHYSVIDPVRKQKYEQSVADIEDFSRMVVKAADAYRTTGSRAAAQCVATLLDGAAKQKALAGTMDGHQAFYVQKWNLGSWAIAYLKIRDSGVVTPAQASQIQKWFKNLADSVRGYIDDRRQHGASKEAYNNHLYWAGLAVAAAATADNDRTMFRWALVCYKQGARDIAKDGTLPLEMNRGQMALHYHLFSLAALVMVAEFGEANGIDLYAEHDYAIKRLVARCVEGLLDPSFFQSQSGVPQVTTPEIEAWQIGWAQPYTRRFPDPKIQALLAKAGRLNYTMLGGLPPR